MLPDFASEKRIKAFIYEETSVPTSYSKLYLQKENKTKKK